MNKKHTKISSADRGIGMHYYFFYSRSEEWVVGCFISPSKIHFFNYSRQLERIMIDNHLGKMALAVLVCTPFPSDLLQKQPDELLSLYRQVEGLKSPQRPKAIRLIEVADNSIGVTEGREMARIEVATLVRRYNQLELEIESITQ